MIEVFGFLRDSNLLTPGILALGLGIVTYFFSKAQKEMQAELKEMSRQQALTASTLATVAAMVARIDKHGTESELRHRENQICRWEAAHERVSR